MMRRKNPYVVFFSPSMLDELRTVHCTQYLAGSWAWRARVCGLVVMGWILLMDGALKCLPWFLGEEMVFSPAEVKYKSFE